MPDQDVILLPPALRLLAEIAEQTNCGYRYRGTEGVRLVQDAGRLTAEATDSYFACRVTVPMKGLLTVETATKDGRFPQLDAAAPKGDPTVTLRLDPRRLLHLLQVAVAAGHMDEHLFIEVRGPHVPIVLRCGDGDRTFFGMLQPMTPDGVQDDRPKVPAVGEPGA